MHNRNYTRSSSFYMALLFTLLCGLTLGLLVYFGYYFARGHFIDGTEALIDTEIKYIAAYPDALEKIPFDPSRLYAQFGNDGSHPSDISAAVSLLAEGIIVFDHPTSGRRFAAKIHTHEDGQKTLVGVDITQISKDHMFMMMMSMTGIFMVLAVIIGSFTISLFVVRGTNDIASTAREIMKTGDLSRRIDVPWRWDDLSNMADTLNMLFARIEQLMQGVRHVSDNIAHDLRTPLMRMKASIAALEEKLPHDKSVQRLGAEAETMLSVFNALLRISRLESERQRSHFQEVNLAEILKDVADLYEPLAEDRSIKIRTDLEPILIKGDRDLLFQAFANILDNAVKYAPERGNIRIDLKKTTDERAQIEITNSGQGLPSAELTRIFERFYRSDSSRASEGTGLGLSLTAAIVKLHDGEICAENLPQGFSIITAL